VANKHNYDVFKVKLAEHRAAVTPAMRRDVEIMVFTDTPMDLIADRLGVELMVLRDVYRKELLHGKDRIAAEIRTKYVAAALEGDKVALSRIALSTGKFGPPPSAVVPGKDDGENLDLTGFSDQDINQLLAELKKAGAGDGARNGAAPQAGARDLGAVGGQSAVKVH